MSLVHRDADEPPPSKPCHNCRRRRLKCDRSTPACQKCIKTGQECLGYGKLFLWNQGVASRGKMMGRSFEMPTQKRSAATDIPTSTMVVGNRQHDHWQYQAVARANNMALGNMGLDFAISPSLIDPLFQDLSHTSRLYMSHFANQLCKELVTYDMPNLNPFRNLIPLTSEHAVLLHIAVANAANHMANLYSMETRSVRTAAASSPDAPPENRAHHLQPVQSVNPQSARFLRDALVAKHKAIKLLRNALEHVDTVNPDVLLAAVMLFVNFELVNSGKEDWKVHVEGARRLIERFSRSDDATSSTNMMLRDYVVSDCLTYYILGSTVSLQTSWGNANRQFQYVLPLLERGETNSYLSCPSVLLQIMLSASYLCSEDPASAPEERKAAGQLPIEAEALLLAARAEAFDIHTWAQGIQGISSHDDFESRVHVASAHKSCIRLYIHRAVPSARLLNERQDIDALVCDIVYHLSFIDVDDNLIKGTSWPTFIAGAESLNAGGRAWAAERLLMLWRLMPWGYISTALETLQVIWSMSSFPDNSEGAPVGWLQKLKKLGIEYIVV